MIIGSNFWLTEHAQRGLFYLSTNAGAFRLIVPHLQRNAIVDMRKGAEHVVVSFLPADKWIEGQYCVEWMVEDGSESPWPCHLVPGQMDRMPYGQKIRRPPDDRI